MGIEIFGNTDFVYCWCRRLSFISSCLPLSRISFHLEPILYTFERFGLVTASQTKFSLLRCTLHVTCSLV